MRINKRAASLLGAIVVTLSAATALLQFAEHSQDRCAFALTDAQKARALGLTLDQAEELEERGKDLGAFCSMPDAELGWYRQNVRAEWNESNERYEVALRKSDDGTIAPGGIARALEQRQAMQQPAATAGKGAAGRMLTEQAAAGTWTNLGPDPALNPIPLAPAGAGRANTLAFDPTNDQKVFLGSNAGMFVSTNGGANWVPVAGFPAALPVNVIAISPLKPTTIYAATGDNYGIQHLGISGAGGAGIYKSTDSGVTWLPLTSTDPAKTTQFYSISGLSISPADADTLLVSTGTALYRSTDAGLTWSRPYTDTNSAGVRRFPVRVNFDPNNANVAVMSGCGFTGYSADGGVTWTTQDISGASLTSCTNKSVITFAKGTQSLAYAVVAGTQDILRSTDSGKTWTKVSNAPGAVLPRMRGMAFWVDPANSNTLIVGDVDLYRSTDGGATFTAISDWRLASNRKLGVHADQHAIVETPTYGTTNTKVYFATDGGIFTATNINVVNATATNNGWAMSNAGLTSSQFYSVGAAPTSGQIAGGTQDQGLLVSNGANWTQWALGIGGDNINIYFDPTDERVIYTTYSSLSVQRVTDSFTNGPNEKRICNGITEAYPDFCGTGTGTSAANAVAPMVRDPNNAKRYLGGGASLWLTDDITATDPTWRAIKSPTATARNPISAIAVAPSNSNIVWVGHNNGEAYMTTNGLAATPTWTPMSLGVSRMITRFLIDPTNPNKIYASLGGYNGGNVMLTNDGGTTWSSVADNLPYAPVYALLQNTTNPSLLYAGTDVGIFVSVTAGNAWMSIDGTSGPGAAQVRDMTYVPKTNTMLVATFGRGMYSYETTVTPPITPQVGWWYNASESGRGYAVETSNGRIFMAAYMYRADGSAVWYVGIGPFANGTATIAMNEYTGSQTLSSLPPNTGGTATVQANAVVTFTTSNQGTIQWAGGVLGSGSVTTNITRFPINGTSITPPSLGGAPETGWWWNASEGGTGYFIEQQGNQIFFVDYMYAADKRNVWHYALGTPTLNSSTLTGSGGAQINLTASLFQASGGQTLTTAAKAPTAASVGSLTMRCASTISCTVILPNGRSVPIVRFTAF